MHRHLFDISSIVDCLHRRYQNHDIILPKDQLIYLVRAGLIDIIEQDYIAVPNPAHMAAIVRGHDRRLKKDHTERPFYGYCAFLLVVRINGTFTDRPDLQHNEAFWDWTHQLIWENWSNMASLTNLDLRGHVVTHFFTDNYMIIKDYGDARILEWSVEHA